jgi:hypothetical protein
MTGRMESSTCELSQRWIAPGKNRLRAAKPLNRRNIARGFFIAHDLRADPSASAPKTLFVRHARKLGSQN